ncbi:Uncharacterised protein [Morganella morganii]|nr:Uncharacterised protein [Morganella morganii]
MLLQVGEIAEKTGLTVSNALPRIQILRQIGVKLKDIGKILGGHDGDMANLLKERVSVLTAQMQE